ncbi:MAG TPA: xanthine dehydrogenase family protein molybdopterin-binding subunit, partial [Dehalococcoidia bacterium]|nr:xanthine dehydrogenase family protein molybdopterin-binding subunit [Dehalococcoidia bacterium]
MAESLIGARLPRIDAVAQATGEAKFTSDIVLPRMLHGKILRSPLPHARVLNVDTSRAERHPGVKAVVTGRDTAGITYGY